MINQGFKLSDAKEMAGELVGLLKPFCERIEIAGSIRREKETVHDIDVVIVPKIFNFNNIRASLSGASQISRSGDRIMSGTFRGIPYDIYMAAPETFETLMLIRTGSAQHNIMLCSLAKKKGWKLYANGKGLYDEREFSRGVIATTEREILVSLLGKYIEPKERT